MASHMASLREAKIYGGVGSLLLLLGGIAGIFIPFGSIAIPIVGLILVMIAVKFVADVVRRPDIFTNFIIFFVLVIIALVVLAGFVFGALFAFFGFGATGFEFIETPTEGDIIAIFTAIILGLVLAWVVYIIAAIFYKRSFDAISSTLGVGIFGTTAIIFLIGAVLMIVGVGLLVILIAGILQIVAFFSIPEETPAAAPMAPPTT